MDTKKFSTEFESFRGHLRSFVLRMTADAQSTEDLVQDTWLKANSSLESFRGDSSLKTWVFAIASNLAIDYLRKRSRWPESVTDICKEAFMNDQEAVKSTMQIAQTSEYAKFEIQEHIAFCFTCISKSLPIEQQLCLLLKEVYEFKVKEVGKIINCTEEMVKYHLRTSRQRMIDVFDNRCALINKKGACHQCSEMNGMFNPKQNAQQEIMKVKMAKEANKASKQHLFDLRMEVLKGIDPYTSGAHELQLHHLEHNRKVMLKYLNEDW